MGKTTKNTVQINDESSKIEKNIFTSWSELTYEFPDLKAIRKNGILLVLFPKRAFSPMIIMNEKQTKVLMLEFKMPRTKEEQKSGLSGYRQIEFKSKEFQVEEIFDF